jgi:glyoxylase-like metal-dependent hydrolase (beta-lactamase superfamily II)
MGEFHRYKIGDIEVTVLPDGFRQVPVNNNYLINASTEDLAKALAAAGLPTDKMKNTYSPIALTIGGKRVLVDTGNGEAASLESKGERGTLNANLKAAGIDRSAIDIVVISHFHADHVNGLLTPDNSPAFPNAEIKVPEVEWKFWMDDGEMSRASKGRMTELFANNRRVFDTLKRKVTPYAWDKEVAPGMTAVGTPGHSIGHTSFVVTSAGKTVYVQSDVCNNIAVFAPYPDWHGFFDQDPPKAAETRKRVYDMLAAEKLPVQGYHIPFPALGRVEKTGSGYRVNVMQSLS